MSTVTCYGPIGALCALPNVEVELHGISAKSHRSGKIVANGMGHGETSTTLYYLNGKRITRRIASKILHEKIKEDEVIVLEGKARQH